MLLLALLACGPDAEPILRTPLTLTAGPPVAGVAEGGLDLPVSGPLGGYSNRCDYLEESSRFDNRASAYVDSWAVSTGLHTRQQGRALWLENGDQHFVLLKVDLIYSHDLLMEAVEAELIARTGLDLDGRVVVTASHTHNGIANFSEAVHFYLGGDKFNPEIFERLVASLVDLAMEAYESRQEVKLGFSVATDWDEDDAVYRDRRSENDALAVWDDVEPGYGKDPFLWVLRVDTLDDEPLGMFVSFGMHGTLLDEHGALISTDAPGGLEAVLAEQFDTPVVVAHIQGAAGDASPAGSDVDLARIESIGENATAAIMALYDATPTSDAPIFLETVSRSLPQERDEITVTRAGTVDWRYAPYDPDAVPDDIIYGDAGELLSPIDEFNAQYGGAFCGDEPLIEAGKIGSNVYPYSGCMDVELVSWVVQGIFELSEEEVAMPFRSSQRAGITATRLGPLAVRDADGTEGSEDIFLSFFPAEPTGMFAEQFRRRSAAELGIERAYVVGYAQDHEGYYLIPEDWLMGGYEPTIAIWGPLQGEHVMEGMLEMMGSHLLTDTLEPQDLDGVYQPPDRWGYPLPEAAPDETPAAGTPVDALPEDFYSPLPYRSDSPYEAKSTLPLSAAPPAEVARVQGLAQLAWEGGDPGVDLPMVVLEREEAGAWEEVTTAAGRTLTSDMHDMLLVWHPDPLYPYEDTQSHTWWVGWQPVGHVFDRAGVPEGSYRFHVYGQRYTGGAQTWPWPTEPYELTSDPFTVTPATLSLSEDGGVISAWLQAPEWGYRLIDLEGSSRLDAEEGMSGRNPIEVAVAIWTLADGSTSEQAVSGEVVDGTTALNLDVPTDAISLYIEDVYGNHGELRWE